jgi:hypothetical protein
MASRSCFFFLLLGFAACNATSREDSLDDRGALIGGRDAGAGELPATMAIKGNCTVAKVGPRHILTAAHCVTGAQAAKFEAGKTIQITTGLPAFQDVVIERTEVQPAWRDKCASSIPCINVNVCGRSDIADVAVIITRDELAGIPEASVDLSPLAVGDRVMLTGYGCEQSVGTSRIGDGRFRVAETAIIPFDRAVHPGSYLFPEDQESGLVTMMAGHYSLTPGPASPDGHGGLCPGDSGGPLYRLDEKAAPVIVGVNANYTFNGGRTVETDAGDAGYFNFGGSPVTNWHTRLDVKSGHRIGGWLRDLGVSTICSRGSCD